MAQDRDEVTSQNRGWGWVLLPIETIFLPLLPLSVIYGWSMAQMGWKYPWWYF